MADNDGNKDFLWGTLKFVGKCTAAVAAVAFLGDDVGKVIQGMGGEVASNAEPSAWHSICDTAGSFFIESSGLAASSLAGVTNAVAGPLVNTNPPANGVAESVAHTARYFTAQDFQSFTSQPAEAAKAAIAGGTYDIAGKLTPKDVLIAKDTLVTPLGLTGISSEIYDAARHSAAGELVAGHPWQAAGIAVVGGAGAEVLGRWTSKVAQDSAVNINVNPAYKG